MTDSAKSINEVQEAEERADKLVADAKQSSETIIREAKEKAAKMLTSAEESARDKKAEQLKKAAAELETMRKKAVERSESEARAIKSKKLSDRSRSQIAKRLTDLILGV